MPGGAAAQIVVAVILVFAVGGFAAMGAVYMIRRRSSGAGSSWRNNDGQGDGGSGGMVSWTKGLFNRLGGGFQQLSADDPESAAEFLTEGTGLTLNDDEDDERVLMVDMDGSEEYEDEPRQLRYSGGNEHSSGGPAYHPTDAYNAGHRESLLDGSGSGPGESGGSTIGTNVKINESSVVFTSAPHPTSQTSRSSPLPILIPPPPPSSSSSARPLPTQSTEHVHVVGTFKPGWKS
jgi:hypothetical protein